MKTIYSAFLIVLLSGSACLAIPDALPTTDWKIKMAPFGPVRPSAPNRPSSSQKTRPTEIRYSPSAQASNMIMPAIWLGLPTIFIIALIIRAMKGD